jgi:hypothetical protein
MGHWAHECRSRPKKEQANLTQEGEEASLLFVLTVMAAPSKESQIHPLARVVALSLEAEEKSAEEANSGGARCDGRVVPQEQKLFTHLGTEEHVMVAWVLDTGATNHMIGTPGGILGPRHNGAQHRLLCDDSESRIEGRSKAFICMNGGRRSFVVVYFIPRLTTNILSVGQLDEAWYKVDIYGGMMKIHEPNG